MISIQEIRYRWALEGLPLSPGVEAQAVCDFEQTYRVLLPSDMIYFYRNMNGITDRMTYDSSFVRIWTFEEINPINDASDTIANRDKGPEADSTIVPLGSTEGHSLFLFADHSLWLPAFAIHLTSTPIRENHIYAIYKFDEGSYFRTVDPMFTTFSCFLQVWAHGGNVSWGMHQ